MVLMSIQNRLPAVQGFGVACTRCTTFITIEVVADGLALEFCASCPTCGVRGFYVRTDLARERK
jgi:hypothetical protein